MPATPAADSLRPLVEKGGSIEDFANALVYEAGGAGSLAREVWHEYTELPDGSPQKARLLHLFIEIWAKYGAATSPDDLEALQEEEAALLSEMGATDA